MDLEKNLPRSKRVSPAKVKSILSFLKSLSIFGLAIHLIIQSIYPEETIDPASVCPIAPKVIPKDFQDIKETLEIVLHDEGFMNSSAKKLSGAIQIRTEITDTSKYLPIEDDFFQPFLEFHDYLNRTFPKIHEVLQKDVINHYGLVFTWEGSNPGLKPLMLAAHQDVVPVEWDTADQWNYHPYSGHFDGEYIWGRGASDCKNLLIGLMESVELLLTHDYKPKRTVILAFGFDEESSGTMGARKIASFLEEKYGKDSMYAILDEGSGGIEKKDDKFFTTLATGEKGLLDSMITLKTPGGHSSVPPDNTAIGIMSRFLTMVEQSPFSPSLNDENPFLKELQCYAAYSEEIDTNLKKIILSNDKNNKKLIKYIIEDGSRYLITTSQAIDIINGGIKSNALPESVSVVINSRINVDSSVKEVQEKFLGNIFRIAQQFNLGVINQGEILRPITKNGYFNYTFGSSIEAAPVTPAHGEVWDILTGSLRHFYEDVAYPKELNGEIVIPTPGLMSANTDTKSYWNLTRNIFRASPGGLNLGDKKVMGGIHSVNEYLEFEDHLNTVGFFYEYIRNVDSFATDL